MQCSMPCVEHACLHDHFHYVSNHPFLAELALSALGQQCGTTPTRAARRGASCTWDRSRTRTRRQRARADCDRMTPELRMPDKCCRLHDLPWTSFRTPHMPGSSVLLTLKTMYKCMHTTFPSQEQVCHVILT